MNKLLFLLCIVLCRSPLFAQPALTHSNSRPVIGEIFHLHRVDITGISSGATGINMNWDFSSLISQSTLQAHVLHPDSTPNGSIFPTASIALETNGSYKYFTTNSNIWALKGLDNGTYTTFYGNPEVMLGYPFGYMSLYQDSFYASYDTGSVVSRQGHMFLLADGYGSLSTENSTYPEVLRISFRESYEDQHPDTVIHFNSDTYAWYEEGTHYPVFTWRQLRREGAIMEEYGEYYEKTTVGQQKAQESAIKGLEVFPNPARSSLNVRVEIIQKGRMILKLYDGTGRAVTEFVEDRVVPSVLLKKLNVEDLPRGIYFLKVEINGAVAVRRLILD